MSDDTKKGEKESVKRVEEERIVALFQALGNMQRLRVIRLLLESERPIHLKGISRELGLDYASTYRHIEKLRSIGVLGIHEVGRSRVPYIKNKDKISIITREAQELTMSNKT
ncbi:MAG: winged helix-turn-helix transcriptional regulator [Nitrososphaerota archaeon]|jgi:ArsR family transcriptional regulator|nr:winged helix-turn-helix transcriptional regulator [Nitrososphaerota archaeon]